MAETKKTSDLEVSHVTEPEVEEIMEQESGTISSNS